MALLVLRAAIILVTILWFAAVLAPKIARADGLKSNRTTRFEILPNATESPTPVRFAVLPNATAEPRSLLRLFPNATAANWPGGVSLHLPPFSDSNIRWLEVTHGVNDVSPAGSTILNGWGSATNTLGANASQPSGSQGSGTAGPAAAISDPTSPAFGRWPNIVELRCLWPSELRRDEEYSLFVYMYAGIDGYEKAKEDFLYRLEAGDQLMNASGGDGELQEETEVVIVPRVAGVEFNPPRMKRSWKGSFETCEFRFRVTTAADDGAEGGVSFYVGPAVVGKTPLTLTLVEDPTAAASDAIRESVEFPYRSIFICYAHKDATIVDRVERLARVLRYTPLRDIHVVRSGQDWEVKLRDLIEEAHVFQLCWSAAAQNSQQVEKEWKYALALGKEIWPVYWEEPMPQRPTELDRLQFERI
jgi:hypothetical protein